MFIEIDELREEHLGDAAKLVSARYLRAMRSGFRCNESAGVPLLDALVQAGELLLDTMD